MSSLHGYGKRYSRAKRDTYLLPEVGVLLVVDNVASVIDEVVLGERLCERSHQVEGDRALALLRLPVT